MTFRHSGDLGDVIFAMPILRDVGGRNSLFCVDREFTAPFLRRLHLLRPLLESQEYVEAVVETENKPDIDLTEFRSYHRGTKTLTQSMADCFRAQSDIKIDGDGKIPWLSAKPDKKFKGRIIIARSPRYNNPWFPWSDVVSHYGDRLAFVGLDEEYAAFTRSFGSVDRFVINDYLELAMAIVGAGIFIGNQSSPHSVAMGLGVNIIQESCHWQPDCLFVRGNAQYVNDGKCVLPNVSGSGELKIECRYNPKPDIPVNVIVPPGRWQYPDLPPHTHFKELSRMVGKMHSIPQDEADDRLLSFNMKRIPKFFEEFRDNANPYSTFKESFENMLRCQALTN